MRVAFVVLALLEIPAVANPKAADVHDRQAKAYFDSKQYDAAIAEFKKSYDLFKKPVTLFKIASAYYMRGDYAAAIEHYGLYLQSDPEGPYAAQAIEFTTIAKRALDDARTAEEAARKAREAELAADEEKRKRLAAEVHVKNAGAFEKQGAWGRAVEEYRAAMAIDGDPKHLRSVGDAYRRQPDHRKALDAYREYLARNPDAADAEEVRKWLVESTHIVEQDTARTLAASSEATDDPSSADAPRRSRTKRLSAYGLRAAIGGTRADHNQFMANSSDGLHLSPAVDIGVFARYRLSPQLSLRPEATGVYRPVSFDAEDGAVKIYRAGLALAMPLHVSLSEHIRIGLAPFLAVMPYLTEDVEASTDPDGTAYFDYGALIVLEIGRGPLSFDARFIRSFGSLAAEYDEMGAYTLLLGVSFDLRR